MQLVAHRAGLDPPRMELPQVPAPVSMLGCIESGRRSLHSFNLSDEEWRRWRSRTKVLTIWAWSARFYPRVSHLPRIIGAFAPKAARSKSSTWIAGVCVGVAVLCVAVNRSEEHTSELQSHD